MKKPKNLLDIYNCIIEYLAVVSAVIIILLMLAISYETILRYFLIKTPIWVVQFSEYALLWSTFLGTAWLLRENGHVKVDFLIKRVGPKTAIFLHVITRILGAMTCMALAYFSGQTTWNYLQTGFNDYRAVIVPKALILCVVPIGSFLLAIGFVIETWGELKSSTGYGSLVKSSLMKVKSKGKES